MKGISRFLKKFGAAAVLALLPGALLRVAAAAECARQTNSSTSGREQGQVTQGKFFCNLHALAPAERARHMKLTLKLVLMRNETVPTEKGYEFQYDPNVVSLNELAEWVAAESKCCPFFDFHIDLERSGRLLCLRLTGDEGIKSFMEAEFHLSAK